MAQAIASQRIRDLGIGARDLALAAWQNLGYVLGALSGISLFCVLLKAVWYWDWLSVSLFIVGFVGWLVIAIIHMDREVKDRETKQKLKPHRRVWQTFSIASFVSCFLLMAPTYSGLRYQGIWLNVSSGQTTVAQRAIGIIPFWSETQFVDGYFEPREQRLHVRSANGTPLLCDVSAFNVEPDRRNVAVLEQYLVGIASVRNVDTYLSVALYQALMASAQQKLPTLTTAELAAHEARFTIPLAIGSPLVKMLTDLHLRWRDGGINANCRVVFEN